MSVRVHLAAALCLAVLTAGSTAKAGLNRRASGARGGQNHGTPRYYDDDGQQGSVAYVTQGNTWAGGAGGPATITYSFAAANYATSEGGGGNIVPLNVANTGISAANWQAQITAALNAWANAVNSALGPGTLVFNLVADSGTAYDAGGATGDIRIGGEALDGAGGVLAHAYYPPPNGVTAAGDTHFDIADNWAVGSIDADTATIDIFQVAAHEIGHALGLAHTGVPNSLMNPIYSEDFTGPQADDIAGIIDIFDGGGMLASSVPEPLTLVLSLGGLGVILRRGRRQLVASGPTHSELRPARKSGCDGAPP